MLPLRPGALPDVDVRNIIFITRPNLKLMNSIAENIHSLEKRTKNASQKELFLYFLPRISTLCEMQLKNKGVYGSFTHVGEFKCDFFPVDNDLLSMELKDTFRLVLSKVHPNICSCLQIKEYFSLFQWIAYRRWSNEYFSISKSIDFVPKTVWSNSENLWQREQCKENVGSFENNGKRRAQPKHHG